MTTSPSHIDQAADKLAVMEASGIAVTRNPAEIGKLARAALKS